MKREEEVAKANEIAEPLRQEPYNLLTNDCISKSFRLKKACRERGIECQVLICLGLSRARLFGLWMTIPVIHGWGEVAGTRIETSRPLGSRGMWQIVPVNIRPLLSIHV